MWASQKSAGRKAQSRHTHASDKCHRGVKWCETREENKSECGKNSQETSATALKNEQTHSKSKGPQCSHAGARKLVSPPAPRPPTPTAPPAFLLPSIRVKLLFSVCSPLIIFRLCAFLGPSGSKEISFSFVIFQEGSGKRHMCLNRAGKTIIFHPEK